MDAEGYEIIIKICHDLAYFYGGTPLSEFLNMPVDEIKIAQEHAERINIQQKNSMKGH